MVAALGGRLLDAHHDDLPDGGAALADLDRARPRRPPQPDGGHHRTVACDVDNPLLGERGAAAVYGPQKGATPDAGGAARRRAGALGRRRRSEATGRDDRHHRARAPRAGSASARSRCSAPSIRPGIELVLELVGFDAALAQLARDDLVVTGEGSLDEQTLHGKAPAGVAAAAAAPRHTRRRGVRTHHPRRRPAARRRHPRGVRADRLEPDPQRCIDEAARCWNGSASGSRASSSSRPTAQRRERHHERLRPAGPGRAGRAARRRARRRRRGAGRADRRRSRRRGPTSASARRPSSSWPTTRCCCPGWSTPTCTSTTPAAPSGRASPPRPGPPPPAASPRSSTCRSTASRRPSTSPRWRSSARPPTAQAYVDVGFWGGAVPGNVADLRPLHEAGVFGFKCFLLALRRRRVPAAGRRPSSRRRCARSPRSTGC